MSATLRKKIPRKYKTCKKRGNNIPRYVKHKKGYDNSSFRNTKSTQFRSRSSGVQNSEEEDPSKFVEVLILAILWLLGAGGLAALLFMPFYLP